MSLTNFYVFILKNKTHHLHGFLTWFKGQRFGLCNPVSRVSRYRAVKISIFRVSSFAVHSDVLQLTCAIPMTIKFFCTIQKFPSYLMARYLKELLNFRMNYFLLQRDE